MRLIDADALNELLDELCVADALYEAINNLPTAYDTETVVKELQKMNKEICGVLHCKNKCCGVCVINNFLRMQIDVVRKGGAT